MVIETEFEIKLLIFVLFIYILKEKNTFYTDIHIYFPNYPTIDM